MKNNIHNSSSSFAGLFGHYRVLHVLLAFALIVGSIPWQPAALVRAATTHTVTSIYDNGTSSTLREVIAAAADGDTITFDETILDSNFQVAINLDTAKGELLINKSITIEGPGADRLRIVGDAARVFHINTSGKEVTISGLTIKSGSSPSGSSGGGILVDAATLTLESCSVEENVSNSSAGGGIAAINGATLTINNTTIDSNRNSGGGNGGGIAIVGTSSATINNATISGNSTINNGGGIYNEGTLTINNSTISGNSTSGGAGAGIYNTETGELSLNYTTIAKNIINDSTNSAGGGIHNANTTQAVASQGSVIAQNIFNNTSDPTLPDEPAFDCKGMFTSQGYNLVETLIYRYVGGMDGEIIENVICDWTSSTGDILEESPLLNDLADNGGATETHSPQLGSPLFDAIPYDTIGCGTTLMSDQRGKNRPSPANGQCDIGAFEASIQVVTTSHDYGTGSLRQAINDADPSTTVTFDSSLIGHTIVLTDGEILINKDLIIEGLGKESLAISGNNASRVFTIASGNTVMMSDLAITDGYLNGSFSGAGILNNGTLHLQDTTIATNTIEAVTDGHGGAGIANIGGATLALTNSVIISNTVSGTSASGGGIFNNDGSMLDIFASTIAANRSDGNGGGITNGDTSTATIGNATISGNSAGSMGGGVFHGNTATATTLNFSTIVSNTASSSGGGIHNNNTSNQVVVKNSILADNINATAPDCRGKVQMYQFGILGSNVGCTVEEYEPAGDPSRIWVGTSTYAYPANLAPLADNGGPTPTHKPLPNSVAINFIEVRGTSTWDNDCYEEPFNKDQRGALRPAVVGGSCDIGAFELTNEQPIRIGIYASLASVEMNTTDPPGDTVENLFSSFYSDEDGDPFAGIAIWNVTNADYQPTQGRWQYSVDDGATWTDPSQYYEYYGYETVQTVLTPTNRIRFLPATDYSGTPRPELQAVLWDGTSGVYDGLGDYYANIYPNNTYSDGAFSDTDSPIILSTSVFQANTLPVGANSTITTTEEVSYSFAKEDFVFQDADTSDTFGGIQIGTIPTTGTLTCNSATVVDGTKCPDVTTLVYTPGSGYSNPYAYFDFKVSDSKEAYSTDWYSMTIVVLSKNTKPTSAHGVITTTEGIAYTFTADDIVFNDSDPLDAFEGIQITTLPVSGTLTCDGADVTTGTLCADVTTLVYTPPASGYGSPYTSFEFKVQDTYGDYSVDSYTMRINVVPSVSNAPPVGADGSITTTEDVAYTFAASDFVFNDDDEFDTLNGIQIVTPPVSGTLTCDGIMVKEAMVCANVATLVYTPTTNAYGDPYDTFTFQIRDTAGAYSTAHYEMTIVVTSVNDLPTIEKNTGIVTLRGLEMIVSASQLSATDVEDDATLLTYVLTKLPLQGTLSKSDVVLQHGNTWTQHDINTSQIAYQHDGSESDSDSFSFVVRDSEGEETVPTTVTITLFSTGESLSVSSFAKSVAEDVPLNFTALDFTTRVSHTSDVTVEHILLISHPSHGSLWLGNKEVSMGQIIPITDVQTLIYSPTKDFYGEDSFNWNASTGSGYAVENAEVAITITAVNDVPTLSNIEKSGTANTALALSRQDFESAFHDLESSLTTVKIVALPNSGGRLLLGNVPVNTAQEIPVTHLNWLTFLPASNWTGSTSFLWNGSDGSDYALQDARVSIAITQKPNSRPVLSNVLLSGTEDTPLVFNPNDFNTAPVFADVDEADTMQQIRIASLPSHGMLMLDNKAIAAGQQIALSNLNTLTFVPEANWHGTTSFLWNGSDGEAYAARNARATLTIAPVNDAPTISDAILSGMVNRTIALSQTLFVQHYADSDEDTLATIRLVALPSDGTLYLQGIPVRRYQEIGIASLDSLSFIPMEDWSGTTSLAWNGQDGQDYAAQSATITLNIHPTNAAPSNIVVSNSVLADNQPADTLVGTLIALDANADDTHTFQLVAGTGSDHNALFTIVDQQLITAAPLTAASHPRLSIRIRATDSAGASIERSVALIVSVNPLATVDGQVVHADDESGVGQAVVAIEALRENGLGDIGGIPQTLLTDESGAFQTMLPINASYQIRVQSLPAKDVSAYLLPDDRTFTLNDTDMQKTLEPIRVPPAVKHIVGSVVYSDTQAGVVGALLTATNSDSGEKTYATTDASGHYTITVSGGTWSVALNPPGGGDDWIFQGLPKTVSFSLEAQQTEDQEAHFVAQQAQYFITGQILGTDGKLLNLPTGQREIGMVLWDMQQQREIIIYLEPNGTFRIPVNNGSVYRFSGWVDHRQHPDVRLPDIAPREINGSSLDLGSFSLVTLQATITGRVTGRDGSGQPGVTVVAWHGDMQFRASTNGEGFYTIRVPYEAWDVQPDIGDLSRATFLFENNARKVVVNPNTPEAEANFVVSLAGEQVYGSVVDETGSLVDANLFVAIVRPNRTKPAIVVPVVPGRFAMRMPENCSRCTFQTSAGENARYSIVAGGDNPQIETQPDGSVTVQYQAQLNTGSLAGRFLNPETGVPVGGLHGKVILSNATNTYVTNIASNGEYAFVYIADGEYTLTYDLVREAGEVLAQQTYIPFPTQQQTMVIRNGQQVPETNSTGLQATNGDVDLQQGKEFELQTQTNCPTLQATGDSSSDSTLRSYPATVVCRYADGAIRSFACVAQPDETTKCYTPVELDPQPDCSITFGDAPGNQAEQSTPQLMLMAATMNTLLMDSGDGAQVRDYLLGKPVLSSSFTSDVSLTRRPQGQANPRRMKVGAATQRNGESVLLQDRLRDTYLFGMLKGPDGAYLTNQPVQVTAVAGGNDGQVRMVETSDGFFLFEIAESLDDWSIVATMENNGTHYQAKTTVNIQEMAEHGTVFVPDMVLEAAGDSRAASSQSFDASIGTQMTLPTADETEGTVTLSADDETPQIATVTIPSGALPADTYTDIRMTMDEVALPSTAFHQVIGTAYRITLSDRETGKIIHEPLQTPFAVTLSYNDAMLGQYGITAEQLQIATFSNDTLSWSVVPQSSGDTQAQVVQARITHTTDAFALVIRKEQTEQVQTIATDGNATILTFLLQDGSAITSSVKIPAGLTVQPGVGLAAEAVEPIAVAEVRVTSPVKPSQQLDTRMALIGGFTIDLLDQQGGVIPQGLLSNPLRLTLQFDASRLPSGYFAETAQAVYLNRRFSNWYPTTDIEAATIQDNNTTVVAATWVAGEFAATVQNYTEVYMPLVVNR